MKIPKLMFITNGLETNPIALNTVVSACMNGIPAIQLREKTMETLPLWELAKELREVTRSRGVFFSINNRVDIALASKADGVHLSEDGLSPKIPKKLKSSLIVGMSVHSLEVGKQAEQEGADYVLFGPIFGTTSKIAFGLPQGLRNLEKIAQQLSIPVLAVGGITPREVKACLNAGAYGVAAISAFSLSTSIKNTITDFLKECS